MVESGEKWNCVELDLNESNAEGERGEMTESDCSRVRGYRYISDDGARRMR